MVDFNLMINIYSTYMFAYCKYFEFLYLGQYSRYILLPLPIYSITLHSYPFLPSFYSSLRSSHTRTLQCLFICLCCNQTISRHGHMPCLGQVKEPYTRT